MKKAFSRGIMLAAAGLALAGCSQQPQVSSAPQVMSVAESWQGVLPCADCEGIDTELTLVSSGMTGFGATYTLKQRYLGRDNERDVQTRTGDWVVTRGNQVDPQAVIYRLDPESDERCMSFQVIGNDRLRRLNCNGQPIDTTQNTELRHVAEPVQPASGTSAQSMPYQG
ncbi:copper resistance protein NlpE [Kushneria indalinina]|nr:copper resistance protein NlpE [Kushneria indalinina]